MISTRNPKRCSSVLRLRNALRFRKAVSCYDQLQTNRFSQPTNNDISFGLLKFVICLGFGAWDLGFIEKSAFARFIWHSMRSVL
ncbi:MAG: hypothetical protein ABIL44_05595 [candidate division WOR-3 bacterium]